MDSQISQSSPPSPSVNQASVNTPPTPQPVPNTTPPKKNNCLKIAGVVIGICIVLGITGGIMAFSFTFAPTKTARNFIEDFRQGDMDASYGLLHSTFQAELPLSQFTASYEKNKKKIALISSVTLNDRSRENNSATIKGFVSTAKGQKVPILINLIVENNEWKIIEFQFSFDKAN